MGKASRRRRTDLGDDEVPLKEQRRRAQRVDRRGRRVGTAVSDYEALCLHGPDRVAEALIARHTLRMDRIRLTSDWERLPIMEALGPASVLATVLYRGNASVSRPPQAYGGSWPDQLAWGVDSCVASIRLLLCGQVLGAAVLARTQLERWTYLRAAVARLKQEPHEDTASYIARVWSTPDEFDAAVLNMDADSELTPSIRTPAENDEGTPPHDHIVMSDGYELCPAQFWVALSEMMHGRYLPDAVAWDATEMLDNDGWTADYALGVGYVCETVRLCLRQLRITAADLMERDGRHRDAAVLLAVADTFSDPAEDEGRTAQIEMTKALWRKRTGAGAADDMPTELLPPEGIGPNPRRSPSAIMFTGLTTPPLEALIPLTPGEGLNSYSVEVVRQLSRKFATVLAGGYPEGRKYRDDEYATVAFGWHRARSVSWAMRALEAERAELGDDFHIENLSGRSTGWVLATEAASLTARWLANDEMKAAAHLMGTGLRSASWLWLEDDDRSMSVLRVVLEQCARMRTWRLKPAKAARLEVKGSRTAPRDWIDAAGWRRLSALNRALGEFAHAMPRSDWTGARELLAMLQGAHVDAEKAIHTARGAALEFVTQLVADETVAALRGASPTLADTMIDIFANVGIALPLDAQDRFNHIWTHRSSRGSGHRVFAGAPGVPFPGSALLRTDASAQITKPSVSRMGVRGLVP